MPRPIGEQVQQVQLPQRQRGGDSGLLSMIAAGPQSRPMQMPSQPAMRGGMGAGIGQGIEQAGAAIGEGFREAGRRKFATQERVAGQEFAATENQKARELQMATERARTMNAQENNRLAMMATIWGDLLGAVNETRQTAGTYALQELKASQARYEAGQEMMLTPEAEAARIDRLTQLGRLGFQRLTLFDLMDQGLIQQARQFAVRAGGEGEDAYVVEALGGGPMEARRPGAGMPTLGNVLDLLDNEQVMSAPLNEAYGAAVLAMLPRVITPSAYDPQTVTREYALKGEIDRKKLRIAATVGSITDMGQRMTAALMRAEGLEPPAVGEGGTLYAIGAPQAAFSNRVKDRVTELARAFENREVGAALLPQDVTTWLSEGLLPPGHRLAQIIEAVKLGQGDDLLLSPWEAHAERAWLDSTIDALTDFRDTHLIESPKYENPLKFSAATQRRMLDFMNKALIDLNAAVLAVNRTGMLGVYDQHMGMRKAIQGTMDVVLSGTATRGEKAAALEDLAGELKTEQETLRDYEEAYAESMVRLGYAPALRVASDPQAQSLYRPEINEALRRSMKNELIRGEQGYQQRKGAEPARGPGAYGPRPEMQPKPGTEQKYGPASAGWVGG